jgi:hypothetical protein
MTTRSLALVATLVSAVAIATACGQADQTAQDASSAPVTTADASGWTQPKTAWGEPDLQGLWPVGHLTGTALQRPAQFEGREFLTDEEYAASEERAAVAAGAYDRAESENKLGMSHWAERGQASRRTSLISDPPDGQLPALTEEGLRRQAGMRSTWQQIEFDWVTDFDSWDRCITRGMPASMFPFQYNNGIRIFQSPGVVAINMEMIHETRVIPTDGRAPLSGEILHWLGESRGRWDGDTLVVETTNLMPGPSMTNIGTTGSPRENNLPVSESSRIVERFTRTGEDTLEYEMTFEDPTLYTAPWTAKLNWRLDPDYGMFEYACHEANYMVRDYINASRAGRAAEGGAGE